ncbi:hypothetical protein PPYR_05757 [Photinus pyralis]|uniref:DUF5641 domain-containing protein n=1 Tax=Photinus pyralis TaxID=7054 RepID=A0A5N4AVX3_PHOPY|nr:hypothetical protein PPYR_05757 [Photinus pyralis]
MRCQRFSSWTKLLRTTAIVLRFLKRLPGRGQLTAVDLETAENVLLQIVQKRHFINDIRLLENTGTCSAGIQWNFIAPGAPHMGGLWESNIKSVKSHLLKIVGDQLLTYEELNTLLIQIECLLNSRPLCVLSSDPAEPIALTPAHFLTLTPLDRLPAINVMDVNLSRLSRYQLIDHMVQHFWQRWRIEYLHTMQTRAWLIIGIDRVS